MAFVTGDVVPVSGDELPFKVVFMQGDTVLAEWLVESLEEGHSQIVEALKSLADRDDEEDENDKEDEDEDGEDDDDDEEDKGKGKGKGKDEDDDDDDKDDDDD